jgi:hypothetical protein
MNTTEHIVESYFRLCRGCFTFTDRKVVKGNNRQLDILAYDVKKELQFHIEVGVTHRLNWCPNWDDLAPEFEKKFFGAPPKREGKDGGATDYEKGKSYFRQIEETYVEAGFTPSEVRRVWVCWIVCNEEKNNKPLLSQFVSNHLNRTFEIEVLSLRDLIIPELEEAIGTANYDDEILRVLGFIKQRELQTRRGKL